MLNFLTQVSLEEWTSIASIIGVAIGLLALLYTAKQINQNTKISRGQFWLELEKMFAVHDEAHINLRPGGRWAKSNTGPETAEEWAKLEDYMGLFEHCEILIKKKLIDKKTFKSIFSYRLNNIIANKKIVEAKLVREKDSWQNFLNLLKRLKIDYS